MKILFKNEMQVPQGGGWYAYLGQMGQGDEHRSSLLLNGGNAAAFFSAHPLPPLSAAGSLPALYPSTGVRLTRPGLGSHHCTARQLELQKNGSSCLQVQRAALSGQRIRKPPGLVQNWKENWEKKGRGGREQKYCCF